MPSPYAGVVLKLHVNDKTSSRSANPGDDRHAGRGGQRIPAEERPRPAPAERRAEPRPRRRRPPDPTAPVAAAAGRGSRTAAAAAPWRCPKCASSLESSASSLTRSADRPGRPNHRGRCPSDQGVPEREALLLKKPAPLPPGPTRGDGYRRGGSAPAGPAPEAPRPAFKIKPKYDFYGSVERVPLRGVRRRRPTDAGIPGPRRPLTHCDERTRRSSKSCGKAQEGRRDQGVNLTYFPHRQGGRRGLKLHPMLNATWTKRKASHRQNYYNIGIAVDVPDGLIVRSSRWRRQVRFDIGQEIQTLATGPGAKTRPGRLRGGTFSITNVGVIGGDFATRSSTIPRCDPATMKIADRPRSRRQGHRPQGPSLCLSFDHRVIDGAAAARFTKTSSSSWKPRIRCHG